MLPVGPRLHALFVRRRGADPQGSQVFPIHEDMIYHHAKKVITASGVPFSPHDLRRGFATCAAKLLKDGLLVKALLNHAPTGVTERHYIVRDTEELRGPMARIEEHYYGLWTCPA